MHYLCSAQTYAMINLRIVYKALGTLLFLEALLLTACFALGIVYGETDYATFGLPVLASVALASVLKLKGRHAENRMSRRDGYLIVSGSWIVFSLIGMLPLLLGGHTTRMAVAFFETMSGFSTTGATALDNIDALPHSILFWRSLTHWMGGMGIVFFTIAVLPAIGAGNQKLFSAESTGLKVGKLHPRISTTARWLWGLYLFLTVACTAALYLGGMSVFDAVNHALSTVSTGGFSTHSASLAFFNSPRLEYIEAGFMFVSSINFTLLYLLLVKGRLRDVWRDGELRLFLWLFAVATLIMAGTLYVRDGAAPEEALRAALFNVVSLQSTCGFTTVDFMSWHPALWALLMGVAVVGGCAGSTSGGIKCIRVLTSWKMLVNEFRQILHPHAVLPIRINHTQVAATVVRTIFVYFVAYFLLVTLATFAMLCMEVPLLDAVGLSISSFSNIGPSIGHTIGPLSSWAPLPDAALWLNSFLMLAGRLEIFSLLLPFIPAFWRDN